ncbi:helix-turn-helix transcriptional regulator [Sphingopyxis sp. 550A]
MLRWRAGPASVTISLARDKRAASAAKLRERMMMAREIGANGLGLPVVELGGPGSSPYARMFDAIGRGNLEQEMLLFLHELCGADSVHFFRLHGGPPDIRSGASISGQGIADTQARTYLAGGYWRGDREMQSVGMGRPAPALYQMDTREAPTSELRDFYRKQRLVERLMACGRTAAGIVGFSVMRSAPRDLIASSNLDRIGDAFSRIFPIFAKHMEVCDRGSRLADSLTDLASIEQRLLALSIPPRERQVAARLLYGLTASCVAADLGIGTETVNTHRKRLYERLGISSHHQLTIWFLRNGVQAPGSPPVPSQA